MHTGEQLIRYRGIQKKRQREEILKISQCESDMKMEGKEVIGEHSKMSNVARKGKTMKSS